MNKVAICFFGLPRNSKIALPSIIEHIINPLQHQVEAKIFSVFNYQKNILSEKTKENSVLSHENYAFFELHDHLFLESESYFDDALFDRLLSIGDSWNNQGLSLKFHLMQLYTIEKVYELAAKDFDPDYFMFVRPDLFIKDKLPITKFIANKVKSNSVLIPSWQWWWGVNDRFCLATKKSAPVFAKRYSSLLNNTHLGPIHSESNLEIFFKASGVKIYTLDSKMLRVRAGGEFANENFNIFCSTIGWRRRLRSTIYNVEFLKRIYGLLRFLRHPILFFRYENWT